MEEKRLPIEKKRKSHILYDGVISRFRVDEVFIEEKIATREVVDTGKVVAAIVKTDKGFVLVNQYRYAVEDFLWEIPAGRVDEGEEILSALKRELREEIGLEVDKVKKLLVFYPSAGILNEELFLYYVEGCIKFEQNLDENENLYYNFFTQTQIEEMICKRQIKDGKTILAFSYYWRCNDGS